MSSLAASGASDGIHVSVSSRISSLLSAMTSWISAALWQADRAFSRPTHDDGDVDGPGFSSMPPSSSSRATRTVDGDRWGWGRYTRSSATAESRRSEASRQRAGETTMNGLSSVHSCVTNSGSKCCHVMASSNRPTTMAERISANKEHNNDIN